MKGENFRKQTGQWHTHLIEQKITEKDHRPYSLEHQVTQREALVTTLQETMLRDVHCGVFKKKQVQGKIFLYKMWTLS